MVPVLWLVIVTLTDRIGIGDATEQSQNFDIQIQNLLGLHRPPSAYRHAVLTSAIQRDDMKERGWARMTVVVFESSEFDLKVSPALRA